MNPYLTGVHTPMREELTIEDLPVTGSIPLALNGRYLREKRVEGPRNAFDTVNTNVVRFAGKTLGLVEAGSTPVEIGEMLETCSRSLPPPQTVTLRRRCKVPSRVMTKSSLAPIRSSPKFAPSRGGLGVSPAGFAFIDVQLHGLLAPKRSQPWRSRRSAGVRLDDRSPATCTRSVDR